MFTELQAKLGAQVLERLDGLTAPAKKVALATLAGHTTKDTAEMLGVTDVNIRKIRWRLFKKYQVSNHKQFILKVTNPALYEYCQGVIKL